MVAQQLQGNDIEQALEAIDGSGNPDCLGSFADRVVIFVTDNDWLTLAGSDLRQS